MKKFLENNKLPLQIISLLCILFFARPLLTGNGVSPSDLIYIFDNYKYLASEDYVPSNELLSDQTLQFEIWRDFAREEIRNGRLPWTNPYQADGVPLIGNDQSAVFFPMNILYYILPINFASTLGVILKLMTAGVGMYLFMRALKLSKGASTLAGIAFAFAGFNIVWLNHPHSNVSIMLPWLLLGTYKLTEAGISKRERWIYSIILAVAVGLQFLGGHIETSFHICLITGIFLFFRLGQSYFTNRSEKDNNQHLLTETSKTMGFYLIPIFVGLIFGLLQLIPFLLYLKDSYVLETRGGDTVNTYGQPPAAIPTWFIPNIYGNPKDDIYTPQFPTFDLATGVTFDKRPITNFNESVQGYATFIFILLAPFALFVKKYRALVLFFITSNFFILLTTFKVQPFFGLLTSIPPFDLTANHRLLLVFAMFNIALGAIVIDAIVENKDKLRTMKFMDPILVMPLLFVMLGFGIFIFTQANLESPLVDLFISQFFSDISEVEKGRIMMSYTIEHISYFIILASVFYLSILGFVNNWISRKIFFSSLLVIMMIDIFIYAYEFNPTYDLKSRFPVTPGIEYLQENTDKERVLFVGFTLPPNLATNYRLNDLRSYDAMGEAEFTKNFREAYQTSGPWELINYLPEIEDVIRNNEKSNFNVVYIAVGAGSELGKQAISFYGERVVYAGNDLVVVEIE